MENGKWKISKNFKIITVVVCLLLYTILIYQIRSPRTYHYQDNIYVRIMNIKTKPVNYFDIVLAGNKNFINCKEVGRQYYKDHYFDTKSTIKELENSCVKINVFGASGNDVLQIKKILKEDATKLIVVH